MDGWRNTIRLPLGWVSPYFSGASAVSFREGMTLRFSVAMWTNIRGTSLEAQESNNHTLQTHMLLSLNFWQRNLFNQRFRTSENLGTTLPETCIFAPLSQRRFRTRGFRIMKHRFQPLVFGGVVQIYEFRGDLKNHLSLRDIPSAIFRVRKS